MKVRAHDDLAAACGFLRGLGFQLIAAHLSPEAVDYRELDYTRPTALVVGTELFGVSDQALALADQQVRIPMKGMTQSLNVSVACAIVLYEAMRQRELAGMYGQVRLDRESLETQRFEWLHPAVTQFCRERGLEYPELDEKGDVIGDLPRGTA
jgi:tRNA (guanosine-2'-O-)-methyltransferase